MDQTCQQEAQAHCSKPRMMPPERAGHFHGEGRAQCAEAGVRDLVSAGAEPLQQGLRLARQRQRQLAGLNFARKWGGLPGQ